MQTSRMLLMSIVLVFEVLAPVLTEELQSIGSLYQCAHGLRGEVFVKSKREIVIKGFNYDGKGPSAWFHGQRKGSKGVHTTSDSNYVTLPYPNATCDRLKPGKVYKDEEISVILPYDIEEFETIGVFCYEYCHNFGHIVIPKDLKAPSAPITLLVTSECPKPNYKACSLDGTRHSEIRPNCTAGTAQLMSSVFGVVFLALFALHHSK